MVGGFNGRLSIRLLLVGGFVGIRLDWNQALAGTFGYLNSSGYGL